MRNTATAVEAAGATTGAAVSLLPDADQGATMPQLRGAAAAKLTPRQRQVYDLMTTTSLTQAQMAEELGVSAKCVAEHVGEVLKKRHARNRIELLLARWIPRRGAKLQK